MCALRAMCAHCGRYVQPSAECVGLWPMGEAHTFRIAANSASQHTPRSGTFICLFLESQ